MHFKICKSLTFFIGLKEWEIRNSKFSIKYKTNDSETNCIFKIAQICILKFANLWHLLLELRSGKFAILKSVLNTKSMILHRIVFLELHKYAFWNLQILTSFIGVKEWEIRNSKVSIKYKIYHLESNGIFRVAKIRILKCSNV